MVVGRMRQAVGNVGIQPVVLGIASNGVQRQSKMEMFGEALNDVGLSFTAFGVVR